MYAALLLFLLDFFLFSLCSRWFFWITLIYFSVDNVAFKPCGSVTVTGRFCFQLFLLLIQDWFFNGKFGLILIYLLLMIILVNKMKTWFIGSRKVLAIVFLAVIIAVDGLVIKNILFSNETSILMTMFKLFANIFIGGLVLWGRLGNRFLSELFERERKVWTPNRIDAS
jgi:hypothetical protein